MNRLEKQVQAIIRYLVAVDTEERVRAMQELGAMLQDAPAPGPRGLEGTITDVLLELGVPDNLDGHKFLAAAIKCIINGYDGDMALYHQVADLFGSTYSKVERCIRYAVEECWKRMDFRKREACFGNAADVSRGNPTNMVFICRVANMVRKRMEEEG